MFESLSLLTLQQYWWIIVSLLASILVFLMFVQGGQTLLYRIGKTDMERTMILNSTGRKWDLTFTTLVTFGGAFFASFPLFYSTSFGGAYWVWMAILFAFIVQAVSYEYRTKPENFLGKKTYEGFLFANGLLGTILIGTAVGTFFNGSLFSVNKTNLTNMGNNAISSWETPWHGLEAVLNWHNVALGLAVFFLARILASLYFLNNIDDATLRERCVKQVKINTIPFLVFFLAFVAYLLIKDGFAYDETGKVFMEPYKYLHNFLAMPIVLVLFLAGVVLVLLSIYKGWFQASRKAIWFGGIGTVLTVFSLFLIAGFNHTAYYPSTFNLQHSLTIENSSSSKYTLVAMSYVSLFVPFVIAYIYKVWKSINNKPITKEEMENETHVY